MNKVLTHPRWQFWEECRSWRHWSSHARITQLFLPFKHPPVLHQIFLNCRNSFQWTGEGALWVATCWTLVLVASCLSLATTSLPTDYPKLAIWFVGTQSQWGTYAPLCQVVMAFVALWGLTRENQLLGSLTRLWVGDGTCGLLGWAPHSWLAVDWSPSFP